MPAVAASLDNARVLGWVCVFASSWKLEVSDPMFISIKVASESAATLMLMDIGSEKF